MFDSDSDSSDLRKHEMLGYVKLSLADLVASPGQGKSLVLVDKKGRNLSTSKLIIRCEELTGSNDVLIMDIRGDKLDKKDFFGKSDPFIEMSRLREDGVWLKVHTTPVIANTLSPNWGQLRIPMSVICNGDVYRPLKFEVFDWDKDGTHDLIGSLETSVSALRVSVGERMELINAELKAKKKKYVNSGVLVVDYLVTEANPSFLDYIAGGCTMGLMVAIDFTGSNGNPAVAGTLHYRFGREPNQYQQVIQSIGSIVAAYDSDQSFPVWGFGGKVRGEVSHCFSLSGNENKPEVIGVKGILDVYNKSLEWVTLSGPTLFSQIIETATVMSQPATPDSQQYGVLLIITDGVINDLEATKRSIIGACSSPLSIIIIGVGDADFTQMENLDGDDGVLRCGNQQASRDIVQFVQMNKYKGASSSQLAKDTLAELPIQFLQYMKTNNIVPHPRVTLKEVPEDDELPSYGAPNDGGGLPDNWREEKDDENNVWYVNEVTGASQWEYPVA